MSSRAALVAAFACALALSACSSDDEVQTSAPSSSASSPTASSTTASPADPGSGAATTPSDDASATPSVTPATGKTWRFPTYSLVLPRDFTTSGRTSLVTIWNAESLGTIVTAGQAPIGAPKTLDDAAAASLKFHPTGTRQADRVIDGQTVYVITIPPDGALQGWGYQIGRALDDRTVDIGFNSIPDYIDEQSAQQLWESVLATVRWKR